jgi:hypothetical protein
MEVISMDGGGVMVANFPDWICNLLLWTAIVTTLMLTVAFVPFLNGTNALIGLAMVGVLSLLWPRYY